MTFFDGILAFIRAWPDLLWVLPALVLIKGMGAKVFSALYVVACVYLLRLQVEMLYAIGFPYGLLQMIDAAPLLRGQIVYGIFIAVFLLLVILSPGVSRYIVLALSISFVVLAFCVSSLVMVL